MAFLSAQSDKNQYKRSDTPKNRIPDLVILTEDMRGRNGVTIRQPDHKVIKFRAREKNRYRRKKPGVSIVVLSFIAVKRRTFPKLITTTAMVRARRM